MSFRLQSIHKCYTYSGNEWVCTSLFILLQQHSRRTIYCCTIWWVTSPFPWLEAVLTLKPLIFCDVRALMMLRLHAPFFGPFLSAAPLIFLTAFYVMCEQHRRNTFNPFYDGEKNGAKTLRVNEAFSPDTFASPTNFTSNSLQRHLYYVYMFWW